jgi:DegV family protein with EDD domain
VADVAVVTDSTAYLPAALVDSLDIAVVSLYYDDGGGALRESEFDGDFGRFYAALDASKSIATTSPPTVEDFLVVFERLLQHHNAVVSVLISSGVSETCSTARDAAERLASGGSDRKRVVVIDSAGTAGHLGVEALAAAHPAAGVADLQGVIERVHEARGEVRQWILLDTLEYLRRGGRIGSASAWLGSVLDLKPIIVCESEVKAGREAAGRASHRSVRHGAAVHLRDRPRARNAPRSAGVGGRRPSRRGVEVTDR